METFTTSGTGGMGVTDPNVLLKVTSGTASGTWINPPGLLGISTGTGYLSSGTVPSSPNNTVSFSAPVSFSNPINFTQATSKQIMQNKVAVFQIVRDEDDKIIKTEFIKELWVETKNGQSVDFQVARDKDLADYEMSDLSIRTIYTVTF